MILDHYAELLHSLAHSSLVNTSANLKVGLFFWVWTGIWLPVAVPLAIALKWHPLKSASSSQKLPLLISLYLPAPLVVWSMAQLYETSLTDYGLNWSKSLVQSLIWGWLGGLASLGLLTGFQLKAGWVQWVGLPLSFLQPSVERSSESGSVDPTSESESQSDQESIQKFIRRALVILSIFLLSLVIGFVEELIFRGLIVTHLEADYSIWTSAIISSLIFSILHLLWDIRGTFPQLAGLWLMGIVLAMSRWADEGGLGLAWGLHASWVFGITLLDLSQATKITKQVPAWVTGLNGAPLAGATGLLLLVATGMVLWTARAL